MRGDTQSIALNKRVAPSGVPLFGRLSLFWFSTVPPSAFPLFPLPVFHLRPCGFPLAPLPGFQCGFPMWFQCGPPCGFNVVSRGLDAVSHVVSMWFPMWFQCGFQGFECDFPCGFNVVADVVFHVGRSVHTSVKHPRNNPHIEPQRCTPCIFATSIA